MSEQTVVAGQTIRQGKECDVPRVGLAEAKEAGLMMYYTGKPCRRGHVAPRYVNSKLCLTCNKINSSKGNIKRNQVGRVYKDWRLQGKQWNACPYRNEALRIGAKRYNSGKPCLRGHTSDRLTRNSRCIQCDSELGKEKRAEASRIRLELNPPMSASEKKAKRAAAQAAWQAAYLKRERLKCNEVRRKRRARLLGQIGQCSFSDIKKIGDLQKWKCVSCKKKVSKKYHVDHVIPLALGGSKTGSEIQTPMAIVILCGLTTSTLLNMFVLPTLYWRYGKPIETPS